MKFSLEPALAASYLKRMIQKKCTIQTSVGQVTLGKDMDEEREVKQAKLEEVLYLIAEFETGG